MTPVTSMVDQGVGTRVAVLVASAVLRRRLCARLASAGHLVLGDDNGPDVAAVVTDLRPEVVILELDGSPGAVVERAEMLEVSSVDRPGRPMWLAVVPDDALVNAAAWASGFDEVVMPPHDPGALAARVEALLVKRRRRGHLVLGDVVVNLDGHEVHRGEEPVSLTATEFRLLVALMRHRHQVLSKPQLLELVWGFDDYDTNVVEVHMCALRRKLEAVGPRVLHTVRGVGYVARQGASATSMVTP